MIGKKGMNLNRYPQLLDFVAHPNGSAEKLRSAKTNDPLSKQYARALNELVIYFN